MEKAYWNGKIVFASDIYHIFENEQQIRNASKNKELRCIDPDCKEPILKYNHGNIKAPYFSHARKDYTCDYDLYEDENTNKINIIKNNLFKSLTQKGFSVEEGIKTLPHHYAHLLVTLNNQKIAIEIGNEHTSYNKTQTLTKQYQERGIKVIWVAIDNRLAIQSEKFYGHIKRFIINTSQNKDLIVISEDENKVIQSKEDMNFYKFTSKNYPNIFFKEGRLEDLTFEASELTLPNFIKDYENWFSKKQRAYQKRLISEETKKTNSQHTIASPIKSENIVNNHIKKEKSLPVPKLGMWLHHPDLGTVRVMKIEKEEDYILIDVLDYNGHHHKSVWNELCQRYNFKIIHTPYS